MLAIVLPSGYYVGKEVSAAGKKVTSISIKSKPAKLRYKVGEKLNVKGLKLTVRYSDKSKKTVSGGYSCVPVKLTKAGTNKVTVKYKGKKASFNVTVSKAVRSVKIKSKPSKLKYKVGEKLTTKGLKLTVTYSDKSTKSVTSGFSCTPTKFTKAGTQKVTVRYGGKSAAFNVSVSNLAAKTTTASATTTTTTASTAKTTTTTASAATDTTSPTQTKPQHLKYIKNPDNKSKYYIVVYTGSQSAVVYGKDAAGIYSKQIVSFTVSTGKKSSPTKAGMYKIKAKYRWRLLVGPCYGQYCSSIGNNYLFHSAPYDKQKADTLQNEEYDKLGSAASHGCIRMCVRDSKWIYDNCPIGTQVNVVTASGPAGAGVPKRQKGAEYSGWDPSDKWSADNPYFLEITTTTATATSATSSTSATSATSETSASSSASESSAAPTSATTSATSATTTVSAA